MAIRQINAEEIVDLKKKGYADPANEWLIDDETKEYVEMPPLGIGTGVRGLLSAVGPAAASRLGFVGGAAAVAPLGVASGGLASLAAGLTGAGAAGIGASLLQDKAIEYFSPETARTMQLERVAYPKLSTALGVVGGAHSGGGSVLGTVLNPRSLLANKGKDLAKMATIQGAANVGQQAVLTGDVDWTQAGLGALGGTLTSRPNAGLRSLERNLFNKAGVSTAARDAISPEFLEPVQTRITDAKRAQFGTKSPPPLDLTPEQRDFYKTAAPEDILVLSTKPGDLAATLADFRNRGITVTDEMINTLRPALSSPGGQRVVKGILEAEIPRLAAARKASAEETAANVASRTVEARNADEASGEVLGVAETVRKAAEAEAARKTEELGAGGKADEEKQSVREQTLKRLDTEMDANRSEVKRLEKRLKEMLDSEGGLKPDVDAAHAQTAAVRQQAIVELNQRFAKLNDELNAVYGLKINPGDDPQRQLGQGDQRGGTKVLPTGPVRPMPATQGVQGQLGAPSRQALLGAQPNLQQPAPARPPVVTPPTQPMLPAPRGPAGLLANKPSLQMPSPGEQLKAPVFVETGGKLPANDGNDSHVVTPRGTLVFDAPLSAEQAALIKPFVEAGQEAVLVERLTKLVEAEQAKAAQGEVNPMTPIEGVSPETVVAREAGFLGGKPKSTNPGDLEARVKGYANADLVRLAKQAKELGYTYQEAVYRAEIESRNEASGMQMPGSGKKKLPPSGEVKSDNNEPRHFGLPATIVKKTVDLVDKLTFGLIQRGIKIKGKQIVNGIQPAIQRFAEVPENRYIASQISKIITDAGAHSFPPMDDVMQAARGLTDADLKAVHDYGAEMQDNHRSDIVLTAGQRRLNDVIEDMTILAMRMRAGGALVKDYAKDGSTVWREGEETLDFRFQAMKDSSLEDFHSNDRKRSDPVRDDLIKWNAEMRNITPDEAAVIVDRMHFSQSLKGKDNPSLLYDALRYSQGVGFPPQHRANVVEATLRGIYRQGLDMSVNKNVEQIPEVGKAVGFQEDGRGNKYDDVVLDADGKEVTPFASINPDLNAIFSSLVKTGGNDLIENLNFAATSAVTGIPTGIRSLLAVPGIIATTAKLSETRFLVKAFADMFSGEALGHSMNQGFVSPGHNLGLGVSQSNQSGLVKLTKAWNRITGAEGLETATRVGAFSLAEQIAWNRMITGDKKFFEQHGPERWESLPQAEAVRYAAVRLAGKQMGTYNYLDQPNSLLPGSDSMFRPFFAISRWSIARTNNWINDAWKPALAGDLRPLIWSTLVGMGVSAPLVNWFNEMIQKRKPKELTYEEWFNLGKNQAPGLNRDTAYTMLAKNAIAGQMGLVADLAFANQQLLSGEIPRGFNNVAMSTAGNVIERVSQYLRAVGDGKVNVIEGLGTLGFEMARDNMANVRMLAPREDERGLREERLARRVGYMPEKRGMRPQLRDPWSERSAYEGEGNLPLLTKILEPKVREAFVGGDKPNAPSTAIRKEFSFDPATGQPLFGQTTDDGMPLPNYYNFIQKSQGDAAAKAALKRDDDETIKRKVLFGRALEGAVNKVMSAGR